MDNLLIHHGSISRWVDVGIFNVKLAKRDPVSLARLRERAGERETGTTSFIIQGGTFAMPVSCEFADIAQLTGSTP